MKNRMKAHPKLPPVPRLSGAPAGVGPGAEGGGAQEYAWGWERWAAGPTAPWASPGYPSLRAEVQGALGGFAPGPGGPGQVT